MTNDSAHDGEQCILYVTPRTAQAERFSREMQRETEFDVLTFDTVNEALEILHSRDDIACIVSDYDLPDIDGLAFLQAVRAQFADLAFILFTSEGNEAVASKAMTARVTDYLIKEQFQDQWAELASLIQESITYHESQRSLAAPEVRGKVILEASPEPIAILQDGRFRYANTNALSLFEVDTIAELAEKSVEGVVAPDSRPEAISTIEALQAGDTLVDRLDASVVGQQATETSVELTAVRIEWQGSPAIVLICRDISERHKRELELRRFKRATEAAGHSIYITDKDGTIEYVNPAFETISGYSADVAIGANPRILKSGEHDEEFYENLWNTILDGKTWENELVNEAKSGERYVIDQTISPITDENDNVEKFVAVNTDITERKRRRQVIEVLNRVLRHNLRNDLNIISGVTEIIIRDRVETLGEIRRGIESVAEDLSDSSGDSGGLDQGNAQRKQLNQIISSLDSLADQIQMDGQRAKETAQGLFDITEKAGEVQAMLKKDGARFTQMDLSAVLEEVKSELNEIFPEAEISIEAPDSVSVRVDAHLKTTIYELLENAVEHNDSPTPIVDVSVRIPEVKTLEIEISDNGPGIPEEERQVLDEGKESPLLHGSGMGLWLVYWAITMAGGTLAIDDKEPHGSIITLTLPTGSDRIEVN